MAGFPDDVVLAVVAVVPVVLSVVAVVAIELWSSSMTVCWPTLCWPVLGATFVVVVIWCKAPTGAELVRLGRLGRFGMGVCAAWALSLNARSLRFCCDVMLPRRPERF